MIKSAFVKKISIFNVFISLVYFLIFTYLLFEGPLSYPDTKGYVEAWINRSPGYPIFIDLFQIFLNDNFEIPLIITQLTLGIIGIILYVNTFKIIFNTNKWILLGLSLITVSPYLLLKIGNNVLTEGLAYPLFLFFLSFFFRGIFLGTRKPIYISGALLTVLILTRSQFLFLVPVAILMIGFLSFKSSMLRTHWFIIIIFSLIPLLTNTIDKSFHKIRNGYFVPTQFTGVQLAAMPFYISEEEDFNIFKDERKQEYFGYIYTKLKDKGLTLQEHNKSNDDGGFLYFADNYVNICNGILDKEGRIFFQSGSPEMDYIMNNRMTSEISLKLIFNNFNTWIKYYIKNLTLGIGYFNFLFVYPIFIVIAFLKILKGNNRVFAFIFFNFLMALANLMLISLVEPTINFRYTFYGNLLVYSSIIIVLDQFCGKEMDFPAIAS